MATATKKKNAAQKQGSTKKQAVKGIAKKTATAKKATTGSYGTSSYPKYLVHIDCDGLPGGTATLNGPHTFELATQSSITYIELIREKAVRGVPSLRLKLK